jgi:hypothetical protein
LAKCSSIPLIWGLAFNRAPMSEEAWRIRTQAMPSCRYASQNLGVNLAGGGGESSPARPH